MNGRTQKIVEAVTTTLVKNFTVSGAPARIIATQIVEQVRGFRDPVHDAAKRIILFSESLGEDWKEEFPAMCASPWHTQRHGGPPEHCPVCFSTWWSIDGEPPHTDEMEKYVFAALLRRALSEADDIGEAPPDVRALRRALDAVREVVSRWAEYGAPALYEDDVNDLEQALDKLDALVGQTNGKREHADVDKET